jgi:hypothetical protein
MRVGVLDIRRFQHVDVIFCQLNVSQRFDLEVEGDIFGKGMRAKMPREERDC